MASSTYNWPYIYTVDLSGKSYITPMPNSNITNQLVVNSLSQIPANYTGEVWIYHDNSVLRTKAFLVNGLFNDSFGYPALSNYDKAGVPVETQHFVLGVQFAGINKPSYIGSEKKLYTNTSGSLHRTDGPAKEFSQAKGMNEYHINGQYIGLESMRNEDLISRIKTGLRIDETQAIKELNKLRGIKEEKTMNQEEDKKVFQKLKEAIENLDNKSDYIIVTSSWSEVPIAFTGTARYISGARVETRTYRNGRLHSTNDLASEVVSENGTILLQKWHDDGTVHRQHGLAVEDKMNSSKSIRYINGRQVTDASRPHENKPEIVVSSEIEIPENYTGHVYYRDKTREEFYVNGRLHNDKGPARIRYTGEAIYCNVWFKNGLTHREDGFAVEFPAEQNRGEYYLNGRTIAKESYLDTVARYKKAIAEATEKLKNNPVKIQRPSDIQEINATFTEALLGKKLEIRQPGEKSMSTANEMMNTFKSDLTKGSIRTTANKVSQLIKNVIITQIIDSKGLKGREKNSFKKAMETVFETDYGEALVSYAIGSGMPMLKKMLPQNTHTILETLAEEFRVRGVAIVTDKLADIALSVIPVLTKELGEILSEAVSKQELIRVDSSNVSETKDKVESTTESTSEESAVVAKAKAVGAV